MSISVDSAMTGHILRCTPEKLNAGDPYWASRSMSVMRADRTGPMRRGTSSANTAASRVMPYSTSSM